MPSMENTPDAPPADPVADPSSSSASTRDRLRQHLEPPPPDHSRLKRRRRLRYLVVYPLVAALLATLTGIGVAASIHRPQVDTLENFVPRLITRIYDRNGQLIRSYSREKRMLLEEGEVPEQLTNAILAIEDSNFYEHGGIDLKGILRALVANIRERKLTEGASTITMQLARDLFALTRQRDFKRKIEEAFLAVELEKTYSKQQILTLYCNMVNLSQGNYGMKAAASSYFGKSVDELTIAEAATLAGIPQRPTYHNPYARPEAVQARRDVVLGRMLEEGFITPQEHQSAVDEELVVLPRRDETHLGPYFSEEVRRYLISTYGETELYDRGLQVHTTLDRDIQRTAESALREELVKLDHRRGWRGAPRHLEDEDLEAVQLESWQRLGDGKDALRPGRWFEGVVLESDDKRAQVKVGERFFELTRDGIKWTRKRQVDSLLKAGDVAWFRLELEGTEDSDEKEQEPRLMLEQEPEMEAALVVIESSTGAIRAIVGGWSYERNEFNRVSQARRQVGSAFKPFVFGAALENGFTVADTLFDGPVAFPDGRGVEAYSPRNFYRRYEGIMTLRYALEKSINVPAVKLLDLVGTDRVIDFARRSGIESELQAYPSLALGAADLSPLELAAAYAAIANLGVYLEPYTIEKITSRSGRTMEEHLTRARKAMEPGVAHLLTSMMQGVTKRGTAAGKLSRIDIATAGKTGTTNSYTDAWFAGFTPRYTIVTWVGFDQKRFLGSGMTGAAAALPIWIRLVERGLEDGWLTPGESFPRPPGIIERGIESRSGQLASRTAGKTLMEVFIEGTEPEKRFDLETQRIMDLPWYLQEPFYIPKEGERMPAEVTDWSPVLEGWRRKG